MSANPRPLVATIYNPHTQSKEALIAGFIARKAKFERLFRDIRDAPMTAPEQHYLIQGVRGMGKTTLLLRLAYEIENTPDLHARLIPVVFNEEEYGISSLADLWERTARYLEEADSQFAGLEKQVTDQYGPDDYERRAIDTIIDALKQRGKKLLLLIDNIGDVLRKLDDLEGKRLREVLLTTVDIRVIGGTPTTIDQTHDYAKPFYEFFKVVHLEGLNRAEAIDLFLKLGEAFHADAVKQIVERQPGRIEAIRRLTGGVIRTMVLLFEIMVEENSGSVFRDLNVLLDRVTPLYKHRMDDLPTQQQKIVDALAQAWDAANAKELAQAVRLESKVVSAQLKQLINNGLVEKVETNTKNHLYRLEERFFNIWYLMRFSRRTDQRVLWLVKFFEGMFAGDEEWMYERIDGHFRAMDAGTMDAEAALYLTTAFAEVLRNEEVEDDLKKTTRYYLAEQGYSKLANDISASKYEIVTDLMNHSRFNDALKLLESFHNKTANVFWDLATCYLFLPDTKKAHECIIEGILLETNALEMARRMIHEDNGSLTDCVFTPFHNTGLLTSIVPKENISLAGTTSDGLATIAYSYFFDKREDRKEISKRIMSLLFRAHEILKRDSPSEDHDTDVEIIYYIIHLWVNDFSIKIDRVVSPFILSPVQKLLYVYSNQIDFSDTGQTYLKLLLAKKQYHTAYNYFQQEEWQLKDRYKPLYYATLHFLQDEYPTDYLRMGPELRETVDDVLAEVARMAIDYA